MPPVNPKLEAMRLKQAQRAIEKMKQKRKGDNRADARCAKTPVKVSHRVSTPRPAPKIDKQSNKKLKLKSVDKLKVPVKSSKSPAGSSNHDVHLLYSPEEHQYFSSGGQEYSTATSTNGIQESIRDNAPTDSPYITASRVGKVYANKKKKSGESHSCSSIADNQNIMRSLTNVWDKTEGIDPCPPKLMKKTKKVSLINDEDETEKIDPCLQKLVMKKPKMIKRLRVASKVNKLRRLSNPPMSVKMKSRNAKGPVFTISLNDSGNSVESEMEGILCDRVSRTNISNSGFNSGFSVTSVPEKVFSAPKIVSQEDKSSDTEEETSIIHEDLNEDTKSVESVSECEDIENGFTEEDEERPQIENPSEFEESEEDIPDENRRSETEERESETESSDEEECEYKNIEEHTYHFIDGLVVVHLRHPTSFVFCGQVQLEVLKGTVEILGFLMTPSDGCHTVFNPRGSSFLTIDTVKADQHTRGEGKESEHKLLTELFRKGNDGDAFICLKKSENPLPWFLENYMSTNLFPSPSKIKTKTAFRKASKKLQCLCYPTKKQTLIRKGELWDNVSSNIASNPGCTVLAGGKGVGKSTMLRFLVNRLLCSGSKQVLLIDFDPGQTELTVPGSVSISLIQKPLFGPNFTHLQDSLKCIYVGDFNVSNCVSRYMDACVNIINFWRSEENFKGIPCLVNTMGFNKGLGVTIMVQILSLLQPTCVIQIQSLHKVRNYPELLSVEYVKKNSCNSPFRLQLLTQGHELPFPSTLDYSLCVLYSAVGGSDRLLGLGSRMNREIALMSYFSPIANPPNFSLLSAVPYCCPLENLYLNVCHENVPPSAALSAFNASLVAMCCVNPHENLIHQSPELGLHSFINGYFTANCVGFGIVRGIDMESKVLYLLTPASPKILESVNCLVLGAVNLPGCVFLAPPKEPGCIPYVIDCRSAKNSKCAKRLDHH